MQTQPIKLPPGGMLPPTHQQASPSSHESKGHKITAVLNAYWGTPELLTNVTYQQRTQPNVRTIIDSGAFRCMISPTLAQALDLRPTDVFDQYQNPVMGTVQTPLYPLSFCVVGSEQVFTYDCQVMPQLFDWGLLLGTEFLRQCTMHYYGKEQYFELIL